MINFFICLIISIMTGTGMAILMVEKGNEWPIKSWRIRLQWILSKIYWKLPQMLYCTVCASFWATLLSDLVICVIAMLFGSFYFFWPCSGIITAGFVWSFVECLNAIDKDSNINVFIDKGENDEN